jgi:hypothetical protein
MRLVSVGQQQTRPIHEIRLAAVTIAEVLSIDFSNKYPSSHDPYSYRTRRFRFRASYRFLLLHVGSQAARSASASPVPGDPDGS